MTLEELEEIERRVTGTTPGPWVYPPQGSQFPWGVATECGTCQLIAEVAEGWRTLPFAKGSPEANGSFLAASRQDVPTLCAALREAWDMIAVLRQDCDAYHQGYTDARRESAEGEVKR